MSESIKESIFIDGKYWKSESNFEEYYCDIYFIDNKYRFEGRLYYKYPKSQEYGAWQG